MTNPVESVSSGICFHILASCFHDHADHHEQKHDEEAFTSSPNIDDFCDGEICNTAKNGSDDADG